MMSLQSRIHDVNNDIGLPWTLLLDNSVTKQICIDLINFGCF